MPEFSSNLVIVVVGCVLAVTAVAVVLRGGGVAFKTKMGEFFAKPARRVNVRDIHGKEDVNIGFEAEQGDLKGVKGKNIDIRINKN